MATTRRATVEKASASAPAPQPRSSAASIGARGRAARASTGVTPLRGGIRTACGGSIAEDDELAGEREMGARRHAAAGRLEEPGVEQGLARTERARRFGRRDGVVQDEDPRQHRRRFGHAARVPGAHGGTQRVVEPLADAREPGEKACVESRRRQGFAKLREGSIVRRNEAIDVRELHARHDTPARPNACRALVVPTGHSVRLCHKLVRLRSRVLPLPPTNPFRTPGTGDLRGARMRGAKSLVYVALLGRGMAALSAVSAASSILFTQSAASADGFANHVRDVKLKPDDAASRAAEIEIVGTGAPAYSVRVADGGRKLLLDLSDSDVVGAPAAITAPSGVVGGILTQSYPSGVGQMTRLTVTLQREASYRVVPDGTTLRLVITPLGQSAGAAAQGPGGRAGSRGETATVRRHSLRALAGERVELRDAAGDSCDRVVVDLGSIPAYSLAPSASWVASGSSSGRPRCPTASRAPST